MGASTATQGIGREPLNRDLKSSVGASSHWIAGTNSNHAPGYEKLIAQNDTDTFETQVASGAAWIATLAEIIAPIEAYRGQNEPFDIASMAVNFNTVGYEDAAASMRFFGARVIPHSDTGRGMEMAA